MVFALSLMGWGFFALLAMTYTFYIITRLSLSFFTANGMINHPEIAEAFYIQVFSVEGIFFFMLLLGFAGVGMMSYIFSNSQFNYFRRLGDALGEYAVSRTTPNMKNLGPFSRHATLFIEVMNLRFERKGDEAVQAKLAEAAKFWPNRPSVSWVDQLQFAVVAGLIAGFFAMLSLIFFWKITDRLVELSGQLIRYKTATGPLFFNAQTDVISFVLWTIFSFMLLAFGVTGYQFGKRISQASYAVLRDLRIFMQGNMEHRVILRMDDPAHVILPQLNEALDRLAAQSKN
jgi:hypothetical protein